MSGPHFRGYHLPLDKQADQIFAMTTKLQNACKIGGPMLRSIGHVWRLQRLRDKSAEFVTPADMLDELHKMRGISSSSMRAIHIIWKDGKRSLLRTIRTEWNILLGANLSRDIKDVSRVIPNLNGNNTLTDSRMACLFHCSTGFEKLAVLPISFLLELSKRNKL